MADRIAIVEDERLVRELVAVNLRHAGYEIVAAENFADGRQLLAGGDFQLAILDVMLPGRRRLRADALSRAISASTRPSSCSPRAATPRRRCAGSMPAPTTIYPSRST